MSIGFGLIGSGLAGPLFGGALRQKPAGAELVAVATRHAATARAAAKRWGSERWYRDWRDLLKDPRVDAVCIATPTGTHAEIAIAAARAGKHVLTEKPMAASIEQAAAMLKECATAGVTLGVIFMYRFMDTALRMHSAIAEGRLGRILAAECEGKFFRDQAYYESAPWRGTWAGEGGGSLMTQTSHTLDLMIWMLGDVERVAGLWTTSALHKIEVDDVAVASIQFSSGALGTVFSSTAVRPPADRMLSVYGEKGTIRLVGDEIAMWQVAGDDQDASGRDSSDGAKRGETAGRAGYVDPELHRRQITDFVQAIRERRRPLVDGREGLRTLQVMQAIYRSADTGRIIDLRADNVARTSL